MIREGIVISIPNEMIEITPYDNFINDVSIVYRYITCQ